MENTLHKRSKFMATAALAIGALALSSPAIADTQGFTPTGDWDSAVIMDTRTGEVLERIDADQWDSVIVMDAQTGHVVPQSPAPAIERPDWPKPAFLSFVG
ncbi:MULTISPECIES: hypothetical protein [Glutamicibacter]|uniref:hypothetical protein n=2 Tax=Glutamicibacter TaxID=1742989 RepID=UPI0012FE4A73|nr:MULTISPECIES: hypothetical protein [Glutamicibacter]UTM47851.1 hypothetical protein XH9_03280 [Glutamicibacter mysorens]